MNIVSDSEISPLLSEMPLLVLAGGRATRLKDLSAHLPKYLMPVNGDRVFADFHLEWAQKQGFQKVILSVGYLGAMVKNYCGDGKKWNLEVKYIDDGAHPLGTGGAIKKSLIYNYHNLAVTYGDTLLNFNLLKCVDRYVNSKALGLMTYYKNEVAGHNCNINPIEGDLIYYDKMNPKTDWQYIDYGFSILQRNFIESFADKVPLDMSEPLMMASYDKQVSGFECHERFWEIGSIEALDEFKKRFKII